MNIGVYSSEMPKRLQSRHSTYQSSDNLCYVCMCLFRNAQAKDAMELYIVAQAGTFHITCLRFDGTRVHIEFMRSSLCSTTNGNLLVISGMQDF